MAMVAVSNIESSLLSLSIKFWEQGLTSLNQPKSSLLAVSLHWLYMLSTHESIPMPRAFLFLSAAALLAGSDRLEELQPHKLHLTDASAKTPFLWRDQFCSSCSTECAATNLFEKAITNGILPTACVFNIPLFLCSFCFCFFPRGRSKWWNSEL